MSPLRYTNPFRVFLVFRALAIQSPPSLRFALGQAIGRRHSPRIMCFHKKRNLPLGLALLLSLAAVAAEEDGFSPLFNGKDLSGWVPVIAAIMGPAFAGPTNYSAMADFVVMVRERSALGMAGPALVKAAIGEEIDIEALVEAGALGTLNQPAAAQEELRRRLQERIGALRKGRQVGPCGE